MNAAVADGIDQLIQLINEHGSVDAGIQEALRISNPVRFEGDNYSDAWVEEAERRGLPHYRKTPHALRVLTEDSTIQLFKGLNILSELELNSQYHVKLEQYITHVTIEVEMLEQLVNQFVSQQPLLNAQLLVQMWLHKYPYSDPTTWIETTRRSCIRQFKNFTKPKVC